MSAVKELKLPSTYRPRVKVEGHIEGVYVELQILHSGTGGHMKVYAKRTSQTGIWKEVMITEFKKDAEQIVSLAVK